MINENSRQTETEQAKERAAGVETKDNWGKAGWGEGARGRGPADTYHGREAKRDPKRD